MPQPSFRSAPLFRRRLLALAVAQALAWQANAAEINVDSKQDLVAEDGDCTLREAVQNANSKTAGAVHSDCKAGAPGDPDTILIADFIEEIQLTSGELEVEDSVFIGSDGGDRPIIFAAPGNRIIEIESSADETIVTLSDLHLSGGTANQGGAVFGGYGTTLQILNSEITGNTSTAGGGGILNMGPTTIQLSTVSNNTANSGGGGITSYGTLEVKSSVISGNTARDNGGGINGYGSALLLEDSRVSNNILTGGNGGGIFARNITITDCQISGNSATTGSGGGISVTESISVQNTTVDNNSAAAYGGGIQVGQNMYSAQASLTNSRVVDNISGTHGGGIAVFGDLLTHESTVMGNAAGTLIDPANGGGLFLDGTAELRDSNIDQNRAARDGGGIATSYGAELVLRDTSVSDNTAFYGGGGLLLDGKLEVRNSKISRNQAQNPGGGMAIRANEPATIIDSRIDANRSSSSGAGLALQRGSLDLNYSTLAGNTAAGGVGGGMFVDGVARTFYSYLDQNQATRGAGIFVAEDAHLESTFTGLRGNEAAAQGGAVYLAQDASATLRISDISNNSASVGAGVYMHPFESSGSFLRSSFIANSATVKGGAIASFYQFSLSNSTISGNVAPVGGGIAGEGEISILLSTIARNSADKDAGGGIYLSAETNGSSSISVINSIVAENAGGDCANPYQLVLYSANNLIQDQGCQENAVDPVSGDPRLAELERGDVTWAHFPLSGSAVVDAGADLQFCTADIDQVGTTRPVDGNADDVAQCDVGSVEFIDVYPPTYQLASAEVDEGTHEAAVKIFYLDIDGSVDLGSIDSQDLRVSGPNGFEAGLEISFLEMPVPEADVAANYRFPAPGGSWGDEDSGTYTLEIQANEVTDRASTGANPILPTSAGLTFDLAFPEIDVSGNDITIIDEDVTPSLIDHTDFGEVVLGSSLIRMFDIENRGSAPLQISSVSLAFSDFHIVNNPAGTQLLPSDTFTLEVRFEPTDEELESTMLSIVTNDIDEAEFNFTVQGLGVPAPAVEIALSGNGIDIASGDLKPSLTDGTDFDTVRPGASALQTFVITNQGTADLSIATPAIKSDMEFTVSRVPQITTLAPSVSTEFDITFAPAVQGDFSATVSLENNDKDENPYHFALQGQAVPNNPPNVASAVFEIDAGVSANTTVGQVLATDDDSGIPAQGAFQIAAGDASNTFSINDEGVIRVRNPNGLVENFSLAVSVTDNEGLSATGDIEILVNLPDFVFANGFEAPKED